RLAFTSPALGNVSLVLASVANIRFQTADASLDESWRELCGRELRNDLLVIRKERDGKPFLDFVEGVVGEFDESQLKLLLDGTAHELQRERVFGVIYYPGRPPPPAMRSRCVWPRANPPPSAVSPRGKATFSSNSPTGR